MDVLLLLVMIAILVGVFFVAIGKGGELALEQADHAPLDLGPVSATDVALLRPPTALWGYNMQVTDEALDVIARAMRDRDIEIAYLQRQLTDLGHEVPGGPVERAPGFEPRHASGWSSEDNAANPWSRLWAAAEPADGTEPADSTGTVTDGTDTAMAATDADQTTTALAETADATPTTADATSTTADATPATVETTNSVADPAETASLPAADDTAITTREPEDHEGNEGNEGNEDHEGNKNVDVGKDIENNKEEEGW
jgi:hypothetical protein